MPVGFSTAFTDRHIRIHTCAATEKRKCDHLHAPDVLEVRESISAKDGRGEEKMTIFKIGDTTPFLFEQNINDLSFGSHHGCGREKIAFCVAEVWGRRETG